jgi:DNA-binding NarL/FixJ family response regulator
MGPGLTPGTDGARARVVSGGRSLPSQGEPISSRVATDAATRSDVRGREPATPDSAGIAAAFAPEDPSKKKQAFGLSRREVEVLALIAEGRTNREIGERLFISQKTVGVHVGNILAKLGASGRVEAAMVAIRLELVPTPLAARPVLATG